MSEFELLARPIQKWIRGKGWPALRSIQADAIRTLYNSNRDLIISAGTAGGKTEAAFLPLISQCVQEPASPGFELVYIGPLKALISDQARRLEDICQYAELTVTPWHGDVSGAVKARAKKKPQGILLITPESLEAMFILNGLQISTFFASTRAIVIDELHSLLDSERGIQMRSLINRMEMAVGRPIRRLGLSATLGDNKDLAKRYLRPNDPATVELVEGGGGAPELKLQLRGYIKGNSTSESFGDSEGVEREDAAEDLDEAAARAVASHMFSKLRGSRNLIFAGARNRVELYADLLRQRCEEENLPQEFYAHHANISRYERSFIEERLCKGDLPTTAVCTSTLELGIDIGDITCVAQIGAPFTVSSMVQRLGRSGRRPGQPQILRQYAIENRVDAESHLIDRLRLDTIRAIAMIELHVKDRWCESPLPQALHLSTLVHQILSVIAERGGASAKRLYITLCEKGPFTAVTPAIFTQVLRALGREETGLIEQSDNDLLLLGPKGEKLVEHYSFYAVFKTPEEYRLLHDGKEIGTLPISTVITKGSTIIFSGRRWEILELDSISNTILIKPSKAGKAPKFGGDGLGLIDDRVVSKMLDILRSNEVPIYLDRVAKQLLQEARQAFSESKLDCNKLLSLSSKAHILSTWRGDVKTNSLALALQSLGFKLAIYEGLIEITDCPEEMTIFEGLEAIAEGRHTSLFGDSSNLISEKFHPYLSEELLQLDALSCRLDQTCIAPLAQEILEQEDSKGSMRNV
ncbi:DEAD/DEAH box helicase [uncultured Cohaesibacter sp.]|uniref:DEAD/DEAH box helicase n=1 Tax=uncultured Cohaesibacter sp. TaxID=1002546 RepID=UPI0029C8B3F4|nr:DEAD/DEAH box helicase [uncultured Cohaesibacter sp.]